MIKTLIALAATTASVAGPAVIAPEGDDGETRLSGKVGGNIAATEKLGIYGEIAVLTDEDDNFYGTKIGAKYKF